MKKYCVILLLVVLFCTFSTVFAQNAGVAFTDFDGIFRKNMETNGYPIIDSAAIELYKNYSFGDNLSIGALTMNATDIETLTFFVSNYDDISEPTKQFETIGRVMLQSFASAFGVEFSDEKCLAFIHQAMSEPKSYKSDDVILMINFVSNDPGEPLEAIMEVSSAKSLFSFLTETVPFTYDGTDIGSSVSASAQEQIDSRKGGVLKDTLDKYLSAAGLPESDEKTKDGKTIYVINSDTSVSINTLDLTDLILVELQIKSDSSELNNSKDASSCLSAFIKTLSEVEEITFTDEEFKNLSQRALQFESLSESLPGYYAAMLPQDESGMFTAIFGVQTDKKILTKTTETSAPAQNSQAPTLTRAPISGNKSSEVSESFKEDIEQYKQKGYIWSGIEGTYEQKPDYSDSWAQINWTSRHRIDNTERRNFAITSSVTWEVAGDNPNWATSGCGFSFREMDNQNLLFASINLDGYAYIQGIKVGRVLSYPNFYYGRFSKSGSSKITLLASDSDVYFFIDDKLIFTQKNIAIDQEGYLGYLLLSGTNKDFGVRCSFKDTEIFTWD